MYLRDLVLGGFQLNLTLLQLLLQLLPDGLSLLLRVQVVVNLWEGGREGGRVVVGLERVRGYVCVVLACVIPWPCP